jgi:hypothetical protein
MQTSYTNFQCKSELLLHPIESFLIFVTKFVLLGQKYIWPELDVRIYIGPMGRDRSHRDCGMTAAPLVSEFGTWTWYKYSASLSKKLTCLRRLLEDRPPLPPTAPINPPFFYELH